MTDKAKEPSQGEGKPKTLEEFFKKWIYDNNSGRPEWTDFDFAQAVARFVVEEIDEPCPEIRWKGKACPCCEFTTEAIARLGLAPEQAGEKEKG